MRYLDHNYSAANPADFCVPSVCGLWRSFTPAQCYDCTKAVSGRNVILNNS